MRSVLSRVYLLLLLMILGGVYPEQGTLIFGFILFILVFILIESILDSKYWRIKRVEEDIKRYREMIQEMVAKKNKEVK